MSTPTTVPEAYRVTDAEVMEVFTSLDIDADGGLTLEELTLGLERLQVPLSKVGAGT